MTVRILRGNTSNDSAVRETTASGGALPRPVEIFLGVAGAVGWIAGYPNALPVTTTQLYRLVTSGDVADLAEALPIYRDLHSLLRWDSRTEFVQAIKLSMDVAGRKGGRCRPPRGPLPAAVAAAVRRDTEAALAKGYR